VYKKYTILLLDFNADETVSSRSHIKQVNRPVLQLDIALLTRVAVATWSALHITISQLIGVSN